MLINFVRSDRYYDFYWKIKDIESKDKIEQLLKEFRKERVDDEEVFDSPEYFKEYLKEKGMECQSLSSTEVGQVYFGD